MRSATILSGIAILGLTAGAARAETNAWSPSPASAVPAVGMTAAPHPLDSFVPDAAPQVQAPEVIDKSGYNTKGPRGQAEAVVKKKTGKRPSFYQSSPAERQNLSPYGPPR